MIFKFTMQITPRVQILMIILQWNFIEILIEISPAKMVWISDSPTKKGLEKWFPY
jgi:hypothetical protein